MATFKFELISPEEKLISEDVTMVTIPGEEGEFGVLAGHAPLLSALRVGVIEVRRESANENNPRRIFVAGGFADVGADHCTVLAEDAVDLSTLDVAKLDAETAKIEASLAAATDALDRQRLEARLVVAQAKRAAII